MRRQRSLFLLSLLVPLSAANCKKVADGPLPVCGDEVAGNEAEEVSGQDVPADVWFGIVLKNYNRRTKEVGRPTKDCSGQPVEKPADDEASLCVQGEGDATAVPEPARPLDPEEDLLLTPTDDGKQVIVWARTEYYENGEAAGPVALAEYTQRGIAVRAIGTLQAHANKARVRLEPMGDSKVLVVESQVCPPDNPKKCFKRLRLLPLVGVHFEERPLVREESAECLGPATFDMFRETESPLTNGFIRHFEMVSSFDFTDGNVVLTEQVKIEDRDPKEPDTPPALFRKAHIQRPMKLSTEGVVTGESLWTRMLAEHGGVALKPKDPKAAEKPAGEDAGDEEDDAGGSTP